MVFDLMMFAGDEREADYFKREGKLIDGSSRRRVDELLEIGAYVRHQGDSLLPSYSDAESTRLQKYFNRAAQLARDEALAPEQAPNGQREHSAASGATVVGSIGFAHLMKLVGGLSSPYLDAQLRGLCVRQVTETWGRGYLRNKGEHAPMEFEEVEVGLRFLKSERLEVRAAALFHCLDEDGNGELSARELMARIHDSDSTNDPTEADILGLLRLGLTASSDVGQAQGAEEHCPIRGKGSDRTAERQADVSFAFDDYLRHVQLHGEHVFVETFRACILDPPS